ncbi:MAG TPA: glycine cleavage system protein GcvH [Abditibacteriaceae bacterium]|jgi:glycine cleavage system H protein
MNYPQELQYAGSDEWIHVQGETATVGISDFAQHELGDVVYVELPEVGAGVTAGEAFGVVESVKAVSDLVSPVTGTVIEANNAATEDPSIINASPYGDGWLIKVRVTGLADNLLDAAEYERTRQSH